MAKIILDCDLMRHKDSGLYQYCLNLGNHVQELLDEQSSKISMKYYVPALEQYSFEKNENCIVERSKLHKFVKPFLWDCDIWHAPFQSGRILPQKNKRTKIVLTIHDLNPLHEGKPVEEQRRSVAHTQKLIDQSDAIICISEFTKNDVLTHCDVGNKPVYVIHNGTHKVHVDKESACARKSNRPFLFGMGYVNTKKNYHVLLPLLKQNPGLEMVIAGRLDEPDYISSIHATADQLGISDRLHITGPVSEGEKAWYLRNCMAFVHPSLAEGFGAPVVEAMLFGKPLFLSDRTSLPEIGGDAAFYFSSFEGEKMQMVFREGMQRFSSSNMLDTVMKRGKQFDWHKSAQKYLEVYQSLL